MELLSVLMRNSEGLTTSVLGLRVVQKPLDQMHLDISS